ncbi:MAG: TetR/AcrR family transcriptional regulator [Planctomycetes bacterium]|nr:TetR/AcrR family transcriptional regulator [Planctomycetota bacterium]
MNTKPENVELTQKYGKRREQILSVASDIFSERGYNNTDIQSITETMGIAKGTLYLYFRSKKELFLAVVDRSMKRLAHRIDMAVRSASGSQDKIKAIVIGYFTFFNEDQALAEILVQQGGEFKLHAEQSYYRMMSDNLERLEAILEDGIAEGIFRSMDMQQTADILAYLLSGTLYTFILGGKQIHAATMMEGITDFLFHGILKKGQD